LISQYEAIAFSWLKIVIGAYIKHGKSSIFEVSRSFINSKGIIIHIIEYKNVTVGFEDNVVLNNINLLIDRKSVILGPNGSGKTTLIKATTGLCPYKGNIYVDGQEVRNIKNYLSLSTNLQEVYGLGRKVKDIVYLFEEIKNLDKKTFESFLREANVYDQVINKPLYKLSAVNLR